MKLLYIPAQTILSKGYGGMYNWWVTQDSRGICPAGWHIPTDNDFYTMIYVLGGSSIAGGKMKEAGFINWIAPNVGADNSSGLGFKGAGNRAENSFGSLKEYTAIWVSTLYYTYGLALALQTQFETASVAIYSRLWGLSIRLIKDNSDWQSGETVTDYDGNVYQTVKVGNQVIMAENYKVKHYNNGDAIPIVTDQTAWAKLGTDELVIAASLGSENAYFSSIFEDGVITLSQGFTVSDCVVQSISIQNMGNSNSGNYDIRLSVYNCENDLPTTKIRDSINVVHCGSPQRYMQFDFDNLYLAAGKYCFVTSYENVETFSYIPNNQDNYAANGIANYSGGKVANRVGNGDWRLYENYALVSFVTFVKGAMCYYDNDPANA